MTNASVTENPVAEPETISAIHVRELKLDWLRYQSARLFYRTACAYWPNHEDYPPSFENAPIWIRDRMFRLAEEAIRRVNDANEREAERQAMLTLERTLQECVNDAKALDEDHSRFHLVEDAFRRFLDNVHRLKPTQIVLSVYRVALRKGGA